MLVWLLFFFKIDSFYDTFHTIADVMYFCQMLAIAEVINPALGLVKTGVMPAFIQVREMKKLEIEYLPDKRILEWIQP